MTCLKVFLWIIVHSLMDRSKLNSTILEICQVSWFHALGLTQFDPAANYVVSSYACKKANKKWIIFKLIFDLNLSFDQIWQLISKRELQCCCMADISQQSFHKRHNHKFVTRKISRITIKFWRISWDLSQFSTSIYTTG